MKFKALALSLFLLCCLPLAAQNTVVSATVTDSDGTAWAKGTWTVSFVPNPSNPNINVYNINGVPLSPTVTTQTGSMDGSGNLSVTVYQSTAITPVGSQWQLQVCPLATSKCGSITFATSTSTLNVSSLLTPTIQAPRFDAKAGAYGYNDTEAQVSVAAGGTYWNVTNQCQRYYNLGSWQCGNTPAGVTCTGLGVAQVCTFPGSVVTDANGPAAPSGGSGYVWGANLKSVSPEMFGAKADGVTDDSAAIIAASNTGFPVKFSAATYAVSSISITNVSLNWDGAGQYQTVLKDIGNAASPVISINGGTGLGGYTAGLRIANLTIDGNQQGTQVAGRYALQVQTFNGQGIVLDNLRIINAKDTALYLGPDVYHATGKVFIYQSPFNYAVQCAGPAGSYANANDLTIVATDTGGGIYANGCSYNRWNVDLEDPDSTWTGSNPYSGTNVGTQGAIVEASATTGNEYDGYIEWTHTPTSGNVVSVSGSNKPVFSFRNISLDAAVTNLIYFSGTSGVTLRDSNIAINSAGSVSGAVVQFANTNTSPLVQGNRFRNFSVGTPTGILVGTSTTDGTFNNDWEAGFAAAQRYSFASTTTGSHVLDGGFITQSNGPTVTCAATITAPAEVFAISGTCEIDTITVPWTGYNGTIYIRPTSSFTTGTSGNITTAMTVGTPVSLTYFPAVALWYPTVGALNFTNSLTKSGGTVQLSGDSATPGNNSYYGTNGSGVRGWYASAASIPIRAGTWSISASTSVAVTFGTAMSVAPTSCSVMPSASSATTGQPYPTGLSTTGFTVNVPTSGTLSGTYQCVVNNTN